MKNFLKNNWFYFVIVVIVAFYVQERFNNADNTGKYNKRVQKIESEKAIIQESLQAEISKRVILENEKRNIVTKYNALKSTVGLKIQPPVKVKTIYVNKVKFVEKLKYRQIWDFSLNLKAEFENYIEKDKQESVITENIITNYKKLVLKNEQIQKEYLRDIKKLRRKVRRRFNLSIGGGIVTGLDGRLQIGFGLFLGYRIL